MYSLPERFGGADLTAGTSLLVTGPPMTGKRRVGLDVLANGAAIGDGAIVVTTKDDAERVLDEYRSLAGDADPESADIGVVDCVSRQQGVDELPDARISYVSSPEDMTGIGIKFSEFVEEFYTGRNVKQNRVALDSLSTLLMYSDLQTVFRFMHVLTSRIEDADAIGLHVIESTAHDQESLNTLKQLYDGIVEVEADESVTLRLPGTA